jgi:phage FluMu protein Com
MTIPDRLPENLENIQLKEYIKVGNNNTIRCDNCNKPLLNIASDGDSSITNKIQAYCIPCKSNTFIYTIIGKMFVGIPDSAELIDVDSNNIFKVNPK